MPPKLPPRPPLRSKRVTIKVSDGWSIISRSKARQAKVPKATQKDEPTIDYSAPDPSRTTALVSEVNEYVKRWKSTRCAMGLKDILDRWDVGEGHLDSAI